MFGLARLVRYNTATFYSSADLIFKFFLDNSRLDWEQLEKDLNDCCSEHVGSSVLPHDSDWHINGGSAAYFRYRFHFILISFNAPNREIIKRIILFYQRNVV